jgi:hypothetical protein
MPNKIAENPFMDAKEREVDGQGGSQN